MTATPPVGDQSPGVTRVGFTASQFSYHVRMTAVFAVAGEFLISNRIRRPERSVEEATIKAEVSPA